LEHGSLLKVAYATLLENQGKWWNYFSLQGRKLKALLGNFEIPNNYHFAFDFKDFPLAFCCFPPFAFFVGFGLSGIAYQSWKEKAFRPVLFFFLGAVASVMAFYILSRFRIVLMLPLLLGTGILFEKAFHDRIAQRFCLLGALLAVLSWGYTPPDLRWSYGHFNKAMAYLQQESQSSDASQKQALLQKAEEEMKKALEEGEKAYSLAPPWYRELIQMRPIRFAYLRQLADIYSAGGKYESARKALERLDSLQSPRSSETWASWGILAWSQGDFFAAKSALEQSFMRSPSLLVTQLLLQINQHSFQKNHDFASLYNQALLLHTVKKIPFL
jgi:tetratricopeptide (TPR) repeat protein